MNEWAGPVIGVIGGSGGVGASTFAAVLAVLAGAGASAAGPSLLIDLDVVGGGIDVVLGIESVPGARWSGLRVDGGHLDADDLVDGLPRAGPCAVLACDTSALHPSAVGQVLDAAAAIGPVVVDLPRHDCDVRAVGLARCDVVVALARADVAGLVAAHAVVSRLGAVAVGVVLRRGEVGAAQGAELVGAELLGVLPALGAPVGVDPDRLPRPIVRVAGGVLAGVRPRTTVGL
jgi:secretion/DNA translocation related CpaE-like protein